MNFDEMLTRALRRELPAAAREAMTDDEIARCARSVGRLATTLSKRMPPRAVMHLHEVAAKHMATPADILGRSRHGYIVKARREFAQRLHAEQIGTPTMGRFLGRDHSTILHLLKGAA